MEVDCEGCAGCCIDWRPLATGDRYQRDDRDSRDGATDDADAGETDAVDPDRDRRGPYRPLDDAYNLAPVTSDEVRAFLDAGEAPALTPRLFRTEAGPHVTVGGIELAAVGDRPAFLVGLRKVPKPVAPFDAEPSRLPTCVFLDPTTLQCRVHDADRYPDTCETYPGANLALDAETECERVERVHGGERLRDDDPPADAAPAFGPAAVGSRVFVHPDPDRIAGAVERLAAGDPTRADRAEFVAVAAASRPGSVDVDEERYERAKDRALELAGSGPGSGDADSWVASALAEWVERARAAPESDTGESSPLDPAVAREVEDARGAPPTPGWN